MENAVYTKDISGTSARMNRAEDKKIMTRVAREMKNNPELDKGFTIEEGDTAIEVEDKTFFVSVKEAEEQKRQKERRLKNQHVDLKTTGKWECVVVSVDGEDFAARIRQVFPEEDTGEESQFMDFSLSDVNDSDRQYVTEGAVFIWTVGQSKTRAGTVKNDSFVVFPRLPAWTNKVQQEASAKAKEMMRALGWTSLENASSSGK